MNRALAGLPLLFLGLLFSGPVGAAGPAAPLELRVMSYNLRFASPQPPNSWPERRPLMRHMLQREAPDLIGTQEGVYTQLQDIAADLPAYDWIGLGREGGSRGEFMAVFYRRDRFEPVAYDHFWLSDTPALIGSATWGNQIPRMVTWVRFRDKASRREFLFWNTHFDHLSEPARQKSAALVRERLAAADPTVPLVLTGDFNCPGGAPAYDILTREAGLADTWTLAATRGNATLDSFNGFAPPRFRSHRIDWILVRGPVEVVRTDLVDYAENGHFPSDHFPLTAILRF
jgi:endonuclease/exonuclease/phosphatase family metal-dependent hydrolase